MNRVFWRLVRWISGTPNGRIVFVSVALAAILEFKPELLSLMGQWLLDQIGIFAQDHQTWIEKFFDILVKCFAFAIMIKVLLLPFRKKSGGDKK